MRITCCDQMYALATQVTCCPSSSALAFHFRLAAVSSYGFVLCRVAIQRGPLVANGKSGEIVVLLSVASEKLMVGGGLPAVEMQSSEAS